MVVAIKFSLKWLVQTIVATLLNKYDFFCVVSGDRGTGKSTLCFILSRRVSREFKKLCDFDEDTFETYYNLVKKPNGISREGFVEEIKTMKENLDHKPYRFNTKYDLIYTQDETQRFLQKRKSIGVLDEMINITFSRDFYQEKQKEIIKQINLNRDHNNLIFACVPKFYTIDTQIRNISRMHIFIAERGTAIILTPNKLVTSNDPWDTKINEKIERQWVSKNKNTRKRVYTRLTTFRGFVKFPKLSVKAEAMYQKVKDDKRNIIAKEEMNIEDQKKQEPFEKLYSSLLNNEITDIKYLEGMASGMGFDPESIKEKLRRRLKKDKKISTGLRDYFASTIRKQRREDDMLFTQPLEN